MKLKNSLLVASIFAGVAFVSSEAAAQTCKAAQPSICTRSCWGARAASATQMGALTEAIVHHTAGTGDWTTDDATARSRVRGIQNYHMDVQGWSDIGYHFLTSAGGYMLEGRVGSMSSLPRGAHDGCNSDSFGFNVMGYYHPPYNQTFTSASREALEALIAWRMPSGWSATGTKTYCGNSVYNLDGHHKVKATACPGDGIIPSLGSIRSDVSGRRSCSTGKTARNVDNPSGVATGAWSTGTSSTDKLGADYRYKSTAPISEPFTWTTTLNTSATWTVKAWWPQGANRSATAPYIVQHGAGTTTVAKNQQANGGSWQTLGSWSMSGTVDVQLSCWTTTGYIVVADGIRWE